MMHHVHTGEAVVTTQKIDIFLLVTTRLIAHSCTQNAPFCIARERGCLSASYLDRASWGHQLTSETISTSIGGLYPQLHSEVLNIFSMYGRV